MGFSYSFESGPQQMPLSPLTIILWAALMIFLEVCIWKIFTKAGEKGWKSLIPFYSTFVFFRFIWGNGWKMLLMLIPIANFVFLIITYVKWAKVFGKGGGFACGLLFLAPVFVAILAFDKNIDYVGVDGRKNYENGMYTVPCYDYNEPTPSYTPTRSGRDYVQPARAANDSDTTFCPNCGVSLEAGRKFCPECGMNLTGTR